MRSTFIYVLLTAGCIAMLSAGVLATEMHGYAFKIGETEHSGITIIVESSPTPVIPTLQGPGIYLALGLLGGFLLLSKRRSAKATAVASFLIFIWITTAFAVTRIITRTDENGYWSFQNISPGQYQIHATAANYYPEDIADFDVQSESNRVPDIFLSPITRPESTPAPTPTAADAGSVSGGFYPTRLAADSNGRIYITDHPSNTVFIYEPDMKTRSVFARVPSPLGIAVTENGRVYVGSQNDRCIVILNSDGVVTGKIIDGKIRMPNDIATDSDGNIFVAESRNNCVLAFSPDSKPLYILTSAGTGGEPFSFPSGIAVGSIPDRNISDALLVADQGHGKIHVFKTNGEYISSFGELADAFSSDWEGSFVKLQSITTDENGHVFAADAYLNAIQEFDVSSGTFIQAFGEFGLETEQLNLPLDIHWNSDGTLSICNTGNTRLEELVIPDPDASAREAQL